MDITYRTPTATDGPAVHALIRNCPPLDTNSLYCNLLQCRDFADTSILAELANGFLVGFISGYTPPQRPDTLFIWQVALSSDYRGRGIATEMLARLFSRQSQARYLETTISPDNIASQTLFRRFFDSHSAAHTTRLLFLRGIHLEPTHPDEILYRAGPF